MLSRLKLSARIALVLALLGCLVIIICGLGAWQILSMRDRLAGVPEVVKLRMALAEWQEQTAINAARTDTILRSDDGALGERMAGAMKDTSARISEVQKRIEARPWNETSRKLFADVGVARKQYIAARDELLKMKRGQDPTAATAYETAFKPALKAYESAIVAFIAEYAQQYAAEHAEAEASSMRTLEFLGVVAGLFAVFAVWIGWALTRSITVPMREAVVLATRVADGDLTTNIESRSSDEVGQLLAALGKMNANLVTIVSDVRGGVEAMATATQQISSGNADLSHRTEEQASSLEETASSMEELTSTVKQNAENAQQANQLAFSASSVAAKGGEVVGQVVHTMSSINESSKKIVDIISVIDGIAFQTNILALNAAVEAARAGEQGRGFAVVASEVRGLAQRSAGAAKEIKELITDSVGKVADGTRLVGEAGKTMDEVVAAVKRVTDIMGEISAASSEQSSGIEQVNQAVTQMDEATQQNAALVEEAAAAAESLEKQAQHLRQSVAVFKLAQRAPRVDPQVGPRLPATVTPLPRRPQPETAAGAARPAVERKRAANVKAGDADWEEF